MELFGLAASMLLLFVGFGFMVGVLFGFFGMGGSFLVTPALMIMGFETTTAVGSGMAFVFGTAVIATLKHRDLGQVDYKLGGLMIVGTTAGIEVGRIGLYFLQDQGLAGLIVGVTYVVLLAESGCSSPGTRSKKARRAATTTTTLTRRSIRTTFRTSRRRSNPTLSRR